MTYPLPKEVIALVDQIENAGYEAYVVGGSVRDLVLGRAVNDWDFTTSATPEDILRILPESFYENAFGTVSITGEHLYGLMSDDPLHYTHEQNSALYEITTYRSDGAYSDHRRPDEVVWGKNLQEDLERRDFTINALALHLRLTPDQQHQIRTQFSALDPELVVEVELIDPFHGQQDLELGFLRAVGDPQKRFQEDALRMMRAIRLAAQMHLRIETETLIALQMNSTLMTHISWERIRDELLKILLTDKIEDAFSFMFTTRILHQILPELVATKGVEQRGHHEFDVWTHLLRATQYCPSPDPIVKFATLLHDIAKPQTQSELPGAPGEFSFYNHEVIGARVARDIARRFHLSKEDTQRVFVLVRWHMFHYQPQMTDAAIRRFMRRVGLENIDDIMALREGDRLGSGSKRTSWRLEEMKERIQAQLHQPMKVSDLVINGHDVMMALQLRPGPEIGQILQALFEEVLDDPEKNTQEYLMKRVLEIGTSAH
jgi:tRNA nucleotidyltransferase (CCA-adding enzyme)